MKIVCDNIIFSLQKAGGISIYWYELIKRLKLQRNIQFFESKNNNIFRKKLDIKKEVENNVNVEVLRYLPFLKKLPSNTLFHSSYYRVSLQKDVINITTVHDFTYEYFKSGLAKYIHIWQKSFAINKSDGIICVSENTKKDILKFYPRLDKSKIKVIYNGVGDEFKKLDNAYELLSSNFETLRDKKVILYVGDRKSSYKNFKLAVDVVSKLKEYVLVSVGGGKITSDEETMISSILEKRFFSYLDISSEELNILYNQAVCLLYPSSYEGFGIPILEAMKAGCPVVCTNTSSIPEVAGDAALLVNEVQEDLYINAIRRLEHEDLRDLVIDKGFKQAKKFTWDQCFDQTYQFYEDIYNRKFNQ